MRPNPVPRSVLVPILGGDITEATLVRARAALAGSAARLALVHIVSAGPLHHASLGARRGDPAVPRWYKLAATLPPERVFVDAVLCEGDPTEVVLSQARRFGSDLVVLGQPDRAAARAAPTERTITQALHTEPATAPKSKHARPTRRHHADRLRT